MNKVTVINNAPCYCKDCGSRDSWVRDPKHDLLYESGKIFEMAYRCRMCGATTLYPAENVINNT